MRRWKPKTSFKVYTEYGKIKKITYTHIGFFLDQVIPLTGVAFTLLFKYLFKGKEAFRITIKDPKTIHEIYGV